MKADLYASDGTKKGSVELPTALFEAPIRAGLMHLAVTIHRSNQRSPIAHAKTRGEVAGSTRKLYAQKHTGRARRGSIKSPLLRGGGKAFGPTRERNFHLRFNKEQRRQALLSCLSAQAKEGRVVAVESYPDEIKTKTFAAFYRKLPVPHGRTVLFVLPRAHRGLQLSSRNIPGIVTVLAASLNPYDVLRAHRLVFLQEALGVAESIFGKKKPKKPQHHVGCGAQPKSSRSTKKASSISSTSSDSSISSS